MEGSRLAHLKTFSVGVIMGFEKSYKRGSVWNDVKAIDKIIKNGKYNLTLKKEREFENTFASWLTVSKGNINGKIISQQNQETLVKSVYCFGKKHRPDMSIDEDGIAIELKYISDSFDGVKTAIGQSIIYRLRYKFVINVFIISESNKDVYLKAVNSEEKDLEDIFKHLSEELNVFSYLVPAFTLGPNIKSFVECNGIE
jgi:hypothetical protein